MQQLDQLGLMPGSEQDAETREGQMPSLDGLRLMGGPGMAAMDQRLRQIQGDPTLLMRNQFRIEELRATQGPMGAWQETRPW